LFELIELNIIMSEEKKANESPADIAKKLGNEVIYY
jgi:hypothetical protein